MRSFSEYDPVVIAVFFVTVLSVAMFCGHPIIAAITLFTGVIYNIVLNGRQHMKSHLFFLILFIVLAAANPLVSHNGVTVLFVMNHNPVTLEALLYGINSAAMIVGVLYWFRNFTRIMTSDKLLHIFGRLSPKLSLVLSMALRFVPLFKGQAEKVHDAQRAMGAYKDDNIVDDIRGNMRIFSIIVTWALENGIITADSMEARGYGTGRRTSFTRYRLRVEDIVFLAADLILFGAAIAAIVTDSVEFTFYPVVRGSISGIAGAAGTAAYGIMLLMPVIVEAEVRIRWKYLQSGI